MTDRSPAYCEGYKARLNGVSVDEPPHTNGRTRRLWLAGWSKADAVKRGDADCPHCRGGHMITRACDLNGGLEPFGQVAPAPSLQDRLAALVADGLTFSQAVQMFGDKQKADHPELDAYVAAFPEKEGEVECEGNGIVSQGDDHGAYVMAWVWVSDETAGVFTEVEIEHFDEDPDGEEGRAGDGLYFRKVGEETWSGPWHSDKEAREAAREEYGNIKVKGDEDCTDNA